LHDFGEDHLAELFHAISGRPRSTALRPSRVDAHARAGQLPELPGPGITWLAMLGIDTAKIKRRAGHEKIDVRTAT
jgi:hypothetical protein